MPEPIRLSSSVTASRYRQLEQAEDRNALANFIYERLSERYIAPVKAGSKNGFAMLACACLLIESLEAFRCGWKSTDGRSKQAFRQFFQREDDFADIREPEDDFYKHVRCGILHQGETTGGWRITRKLGAKFFQRNPPTLHADRFLNRLDRALRDYSGDLQRAEWNETIWRNFLQKMDAVISNCTCDRNA